MGYGKKKFSSSSSALTADATSARIAGRWVHI
jgi:hypothetical protein